MCSRSPSSDYEGCPGCSSDDCSDALDVATATIEKLESEIERRQAERRDLLDVKAKGIDLTVSEWYARTAEAEGRAKKIEAERDALVEEDAALLQRVADLETERDALQQWKARVIQLNNDHKIVLPWALLSDEFKDKGENT